MSVMSNDDDMQELINEFNILESKVFLLVTTIESLERRLVKIEKMADIDPPKAARTTTAQDEHEQCIIN